MKYAPHSVKARHWFAEVADFLAERNLLEFAAGVEFGYQGAVVF